MKRNRNSSSCFSYLNQFRPRKGFYTGNEKASGWNFLDNFSREQSSKKASDGNEAQGQKKPAWKS
jgi:hypothetical protein